MNALPKNKFYVEKTPLHALHIDKTEGQIIAIIRNPDDAISSAIAAPFVKRNAGELEIWYSRIHENLLKYKDRVIFIDYKRIVKDINHIQKIFYKCNLEKHVVELTKDVPFKGFFNKKKPYKASDMSHIYYKKCRKLCLK